MNYNDSTKQKSNAPFIIVGLVILLLWSIGLNACLFFHVDHLESTITSMKHYQDIMASEIAEYEQHIGYVDNGE